MRSLLVPVVALSTALLLYPASADQDDPQPAASNSETAPDELLWRSNLGPGVQYTFEARGDVPLAIYTLTVDTSRQDIIMEPRFAGDMLFGRRQPIDRIVEQAYEPESRPFGAINTDFGSNRANRPPGPFVGLGTTWLLPSFPERSTVAVDEDGNIFIGTPTMEVFLRGPENSEPVQVETVNLQFIHRNNTEEPPPANMLFTWPSGEEAPEPPEGFLSFSVELDGEELLPNAPASGTVTGPPGTSALTLDTNRLVFHLRQPLPDWIESGSEVAVEVLFAELPGKVVGATGGGPLILKDGEILDPMVQGPLEDFGALLYARRHPRTAIGVKGDGKTVVAMVVDGRRGHSRGVDLIELAELMKEKGAVTATNLDGGGSTTMVVQGEIVNIVAGSGPRSLATSILFRRLGPLE